MQPTLVFDSATGAPTQNSADVSRAQVGFVVGGRPYFSAETAAILRARLSAASAIIAVTLAAAFVGNIVSGVTSLWWLRALVLCIATGAVFVIRYRPGMSLRQLRVLELGVFGSVVLQLSLMLVTRVDDFASLGDATSVAAVRQQFLGAWCILIFIYGTLMPNTWKRAAVVLFPVAILPYPIIAIQRWFSPEVAFLLDQDRASSVLPLTVIAAAIATFATHIINSVRREAFKARQYGQYRLMERLGSGGMGEVYKAEHVLLKRPCAIKLIKSSDEADAVAVARFEKEVKTTAKLTHWNTIEIYDYGRTDDGTFYYVMELLRGMSLDELVAGYGPLPPARVIHLLRQICGALQEAHSVGLIHRDIKPANIFASQRGGVFDVAKLLDFGLVKEGVERSGGGGKSASVSGTPSYMSPEQASSYDDVDGRADIYSLGGVAYFLLTGETPFTGKNVLEVLAAHRNQEVVPPSKLMCAVPADLDRVILKCMAKLPADRFQDAASLMAALNDCEASQGWGAEQAANWWRGVGALPFSRTADAKSLDDATLISR